MFTCLETSRIHHLSAEDPHCRKVLSFTAAVEDLRAPDGNNIARKWCSSHVSVVTKAAGPTARFFFFFFRGGTTTCHGVHQRMTKGVQGVDPMHSETQGLRNLKVRTGWSFGFLVSVGLSTCCKMIRSLASRFRVV